MRVLIEISARHIHLSQKDLDKLFGPGYQLKIKKELSQKGEFAAWETVDLIGPKNTIKNVRVLCPVRAKTQIELSMTDSYILGLEVPIRLSGDIKGTPGIKITGPKGSLNLLEGVIVAKRHLHISEVEAKKINLKANSKVKIRITGERAVIWENIIVRVNKNFSASVHLDTDEANAAGLRTCGKGDLII